jgi:hypothetical protein
MANELTYDPTPYDAPEFTEEELDALRVGEELAAQEEDLLAGKYRDAEELERAYIELQKKLGSREGEDGAEYTEDETVDETEEEEELPIDGSILDIILQQAQAGEFSDEVLDVVENLSAAQVIDMFLERGGAAPEAAPLSEGDVAEFKDMVGGDQAYSDMIQWAAENLNPQEVQVFDQVIERGDPQAIYFAIQSLGLRYRDAQGYDGELLTGRAPTRGDEGFRSQAEVVRAMSDPRYDNDPAYRQDVFDKLERSNIQY